VLFFLYAIGIQASVTDTFPVNRLDTVHVYYGLDISYLLREDTAMISVRKLGDIVELLRAGDREVTYWREKSRYDEDVIRIQNDMNHELEKQVELWRNRSVMYKDMYDHTIDDVHKLHNMVKDCVDIGDMKSKRGRLHGFIIGCAVGVVSGILTAAILLK
jgi:hypothetical protein